jgi:hypothetical protein
MLAKLQALIRERRIRKAFSACVNPAVVKQIVKGDLESSGLRREVVAFVILEVPISPELPQQLSALAELALAHDAVLHDIVCNVMVATFGVFPDTRNTVDRCAPFVKVVVAQFGNGVRVVFAHGEAEVGNLEGPHRFSFTFVHPAFPSALALLSTVPWVEAKNAAIV